MVRIPLATAAVVVALAGCSSEADGPEIERRLKAEIASLRSEVSGARAAAGEAATRAASGEQRARELEAGLQAVDRAVAEQRNEAGRLRARLAELEGALGRIRDERRPGVDATAPEGPVATGPEHAYAAALARFRAGEHAQAVLDFRDFLGRHPRHRLAVNAQYWIGEAYFAAGEWRQALIEFERVTDGYGETGKSADALLMMGRCLASLDESPRAQLAWERVVREYPASSAATHAQRFLRTSRGPAAP